MKRYSSIIISLASAAMLSLVATSAFATSKYAQVTESLTGDNGFGGGPSIGPVSYWHFEEANGVSQAQPAYGVGAPVLEYDNIWNGSSFHPAKVSAAGIDGNGVLFGGAGSQFVSNTGVGLSGGNLGSFTPHSFTIEYWVKPVNNSLGHFDSINGSDMFTGAGGLSYWQAYGLQNGAFGVSVNGGSAPVHLIQYTSPVPNGQWSMLAATFTQTSAGTSGESNAEGDWHFYVNGQPQQLQVYDGLQWVNQGTVYHETGLLSYANRNPWGGVYQFFESQSTVADELAIFDFALSQNQLLDQFYAVPEPGMLSLLALGGTFLVWRRKVAAKRA